MAIWGGLLRLVFDVVDDDAAIMDDLHETSQLVDVGLAIGSVGGI